MSDILATENNVQLTTEDGYLIMLDGPLAAPVLRAVPTGAGFAKLTWTAEDAATGFKVYRDTHPTATTLHDTLGDVHFAFYTGSANTTYWFRIKATGTGDDSDYSNEVKVHIGHGTAPEDAISPTHALKVARTDQ